MDVADVQKQRVKGKVQTRKNQVLKLMTTREIFDRYQYRRSNIAGTFIVVDETRIPVAYKRIYTVVAANSGDRCPSKIRFGLHFDARNHWYEEEPNPAQNVYYHTEREYHTKMTRLGVVAFHGLQIGDIIVVNWHGYDQPLKEKQV